MCDKLQNAKDGSIDLCYRRLPEFSAHVSHQYVSSTNNKYISNRKQSKCHSKNNSSRYRRDDSGIDDTLELADTKKHQFHNGNSESRRGQGEEGGSRGRYGMKECAKISDEHLALGNGRRECGKKKLLPVSLNHLLNFTVTSRTMDRWHPGSSVMASSARHRRRNTCHSFNKEQFLQANCQFIVSTSGDYNIHCGDPDKLVEWDCIEQVRFFCHEIPSCPICLYSTKAAKITRCGHVYCWSCLLHYLSVGGNKWSKCPICNESIYRKDIKSVAALSSPQYKVGDTIAMKLMIREKGAMQAFPKVEWNDKKDKLLTIEDASVSQFVKLLSATPTQVLSLIIEPEKVALEAQLAGLEQGEESEECFIQAALEDLKVREDELTQTKSVRTEVDGTIAVVQPHYHIASPGSLANPMLTSFLRASTAPVPNCLSRISCKAYANQFLENEYLSTFSEDEKVGSSDSFQSFEDEEDKAGVDGSNYPDEIMFESTTFGSNSCSSPRSVTSEESCVGETASAVQGNKKNLIYFYQASDGQHLYMHPINTKCLAKEYDGLENCPFEITATLVEIEQFVMLEELRGRFRSLSHLPLTCELALCEMDLKPPTVSHATLKQFSDEIQKRRQKRTKKRKDERRREKRAEAKNNCSENTFEVSSAAELTPENFHDFLSLASSPLLIKSGTAREKAESEEQHEATPTSTDICVTPSAPSFAQALQSKSPSIWPTKPLPCKDQLLPKQQHHLPSARQSEEENCLIPSFQEAFNEAFVTASESVLAAQKASGGKPGSKTAKKGRKKIVLFSTGGNRGTC